MKINFTYADGKPVSAEAFWKTETGEFEMSRTVKFVLDASKNVAYSATQYYSGGQPDPEDKDTAYFRFNADKQVTGVSMSDEDVWDWKLDKGNVIYQPYTYTSDEVVYNYSYEQKFDNHKNPFAENGLGILLFSLFRTSYASLDHIFSVNNPVSYKETRKRERASGGNLRIWNETTTKAFTYDENGAPKTMSQKYTRYYEKNGGEPQLEAEYSEEYTFTCIKKTI